MSSFITDSDRAILCRAAADRKSMINADMFSDEVYLCMCHRVIAGQQVAGQQVVFPGSYIDECHSVDSQMVLNYGKIPSIAGTNVYANSDSDSDTMFCTFVTYITSHMQVETTRVSVFRQLDDGQYAIQL